VSHTSFDGLRGDFPEPILQLIEPFSHDFQRIQRDLGMAVYQLEEICLAPAYLDGWRHCIGIRGISTIGKGGRGSEYFAGTDEPDDYLCSIASRLRDAHTSFEERVRPNPGVTLIEYPSVLCKNETPSRPARFIEHPRRNTSK
jgi:hypothetical protein